MNQKALFLSLTVLLLASLACSLTGGGVSPDSSSSSSGGIGKYNTEFPLPPKVENFMNLGDNAINYQTPMKLTEVMDFYHDEFDKAGYDERDILTSIEDTTFSLVWDGHPSGKAIVVQGVDLGNGTTNVNVRLEDV